MGSSCHSQAAGSVLLLPEGLGLDWVGRERGRAEPLPPQPCCPPTACHILECPEGLAQDVISTIGQAFELRFKQYLKNPPKLVTPHDR